MSTTVNAMVRRLLSDCRAAMWKERMALGTRSDHPPRWDELTKLLKRIDRVLGDREAQS